MASSPPLLSAVTSSSRNLLLLLRCISFAKKAQVRISAEGIRISSDQGSAMEAFVFLEKALFTTYKYSPSAPASSQDSLPDPPIFEVSMPALLESLNIFSLSDPATTKRPAGADSYSAFAAHRLSRHAGINVFSNATLGLTGICTLTYAGEGSPLRIHMNESNITTTCDLTTYGLDSSNGEEIPFARDDLTLKTILRSPTLLDSINELSTLGPTNITIRAAPPSTRNTSTTGASNLTFTASGALGSATVSFTTQTTSETPILETFHCPQRTEASFLFSHVKAASRAMAAATKVSLRLDAEGVLSLQFLVEMEGLGEGEGVAFVDFRMVPLVGEGEEGSTEGDDEEN